MQVALIPYWAKLMAGQLAQHPPLYSTWFAGHETQFVADPTQLAHLKSQTWQTPLLTYVPSTQFKTQDCWTAEVWR